MKESDIKNAELALAITLHTSVKELTRGRQKNLLERLSKLAERQIKELPKPSQTGMREIKKALDRFGELTGWGKHEKNLQTYVSAITLIFDKREYKKINETLINIMDYTQRHKTINPACFWSADMIVNYWNLSFYGDKIK